MSDLSAFRAAVDSELEAFIDQRAGELAALSSKATPLAEVLAPMLAGGKRLRPMFAAAGCAAAGGDPLSPAFVKAAASLELVQISALVHDDLIDGSDTRRGLPSAHREFERRHRLDALAGSAEGFGEAAAVLLGDLCLAWASQLFHSAALPTADHRTATLAFDSMLTEVTAGQYLDLWEQQQLSPEFKDIMRVLELKTAKYTVERPLHIGVAAAGGAAGLAVALSDYGVPLGVAFQLRDDLLGVFGDPQVTGKPAGDDIREGKQTALVAIARARADESQRAVLSAALGERELGDRELAEVRELLVQTGAVAAIEELIAEQLRLVDAALAAAALASADTAWLRELAVAATRRSS